MTWTRLSDDFADHPDLLAASRSARLLFVEMLVYGNRHGTDGYFRHSLVARVTDAHDWPDLVEELLKLELLAEPEPSFLTIDWSRWAQEPADKVRERKQANAEANQLYRERGKRHGRGDHSLCTRRCPAVRDGSHDASRTASRDNSRDGSRDAYPSRPDPSRPEEREREGGTSPADRSAGAPRTAGAAAMGPGITPYQLGVTPTVTVVRR